MTREEWIVQAQLSARARGVPDDEAVRMVRSMADAAEAHFGSGTVPWADITLVGGTLQ